MQYIVLLYIDKQNLPINCKVNLTNLSEFRNKIHKYYDSFYYEGYTHVQDKDPDHSCQNQQFHPENRQTIQTYKINSPRMHSKSKSSQTKIAITTTAIIKYNSKSQAKSSGRGKRIWL